MLMCVHFIIASLHRLVTFNYSRERRVFVLLALKFSSQKSPILHQGCVDPFTGWRLEWCWEGAFGSKSLSGASNGATSTGWEAGTGIHLKPSWDVVCKPPIWVNKNVATFFRRDPAGADAVSEDGTEGSSSSLLAPDMDLILALGHWSSSRSYGCL